MFISEDTLDDLLRRVLDELLTTTHRVNATRGSGAELLGVLLEIKNPRARLSRTEMKGKLFSALGELLWYLSKTNDLHFISYYVAAYKDESEDGSTVYGAYGPRLFDMRGNDQVANVLTLLRARPESRRAVIQVFSAEDIADDRIEIPCTCALQFIIRDGSLHMFTSMRSNDAFLGLPHDVFAFTMLQELMARTLGVALGTYKHVVGSLHLYDCHKAKAAAFLAEGWQSTIPMASMPEGDPWPSVQVLLEAEAAVRAGQTGSFYNVAIDPYWRDLLLLLMIYRASGNVDEISRLRAKVTSDVYVPYIEQRYVARPPDPVPVQQMMLPFAQMLNSLAPPKTKPA